MNETIDDLNESGKSDDYCNSNLCYKTVVDSNDKSIVIPTESFFDKYYDIIMSQYVEDMTMSNDDFSKYKYNPKRLSYDAFGTVELWGAILRINGMASVTDFNKETIKMFDSSFLAVINEMINLEEDEKYENDEYILNNT